MKTNLISKVFRHYPGNLRHNKPECRGTDGSSYTIDGSTAEYVGAVAQQTGVLAQYTGALTQPAGAPQNGPDRLHSRLDLRRTVWTYCTAGWTSAELPGSITQQPGLPRNTLDCLLNTPKPPE